MRDEDLGSIFWCNYRDAIRCLSASSFFLSSSSFGCTSCFVVTFLEIPVYLLDNWFNSFLMFPMLFRLFIWNLIASFLCNCGTLLCLKSNRSFSCYCLSFSYNVSAMFNFGIWSFLRSSTNSSGPTKIRYFLRAFYAWTLFLSSSTSWAKKIG